MIKLLLLLLLAYTSIVSGHPHHHSLAVFDYNKESRQFELSFKILTEDYKKLLKNHKVEKYINKHLKLSVYTQELKAVFHGHEMEVEYTWLYFTFDFNFVSETDNAIQLIVYNSVLININENQFNTVKINMSGQHLSHNFSSSETSHTFIIP